MRWAEAGRSRSLGAKVAGVCSQAATLLRRAYEVLIPYNTTTLSVQQKDVKTSPPNGCYSNILSTILENLYCSDACICNLTWQNLSTLWGKGYFVQACNNITATHESALLLSQCRLTRRDVSFFLNCGNPRLTEMWKDYFSELWLTQKKKTVGKQLAMQDGHRV